jgi:FtsP/CotA-like multicopper oxidase with cupredoxin domain
MVPDANRWVYSVIDTRLPVPHPIHVHGRGFYFFFLAQATSATYDLCMKLNLDNPPRKDVVTLPASGYLIISFYTDNSGTWLVRNNVLTM